MYPMLRHCAQCRKELLGPLNEGELHLLTTYAHVALPFCGTICLGIYLLTAPAHRKEMEAALASPNV